MKKEIYLLKFKKNNLTNYINVVKESMNTVRLGNILFVIFGSMVATVVANKADMVIGNRKEMYLAAAITFIESIFSWGKELIVEGRSLGKLSKKISMSLVYGSVIFISSEAFLFLSFIGTSYDRFANQVLVERTSFLASPSAIFNFGEVLGGTAMLVLSSVAFNVYKAHYDSYDTSEFFTLNGKVGQLLGITFVSLQLSEYVGSNVSIYTTAVSSSFFLVTGFHGLHVIIGLILMVQQQELATIEMRSGINIGMFFSLIYWHFVDAVWIVVLVVIYLVQTSAIWSI